MNVLHPLFNNAFLFAKEVIVCFAANVFAAKAVKVGQNKSCGIVFTAAPILYLYAVAYHLAEGNDACAGQEHHGVELNEV